ncbi:MAG: hypothetical protein LV473_09335 [Nitrospira sp.]|nr:hypothetical protein [Nitrospira sp.]
MDELGVTGKDDTLCSDCWCSCTTYDRQQFDWKYPGQPLKDLLRYGDRIGRISRAMGEIGETSETRVIPSITTTGLVRTDVNHGQTKISQGVNGRLVLERETLKKFIRRRW